eukprot:1531996-Pleurochrysis_carterae.AAC.1
MTLVLIAARPSLYHALTLSVMLVLKKSTTTSSHNAPRLCFYSDVSWKTTYIAQASGCVAAMRNTFLSNFFSHLLNAIGNKLTGSATVLLMDIRAAVEQADLAATQED